MAPNHNLIVDLFSLVLLILISTAYSQNHPCLAEHKDALLQLQNEFSYSYLYVDLLFICQFDMKKYTEDPVFHKKGPLSWSEDRNCCLWDGVNCDHRTGAVIGLDISCNALKGTIDNSSSLPLLQSLQSLNLSHNHFSGSLDPFSQLKNLMHLDLSFNNFSGIIPHEIAHLSQLLSLNLSANNLELTSPLVESLIQNLMQIQELNLKGVRMDTVSPRSLWNLSTTLTSLTLSSCNLTGSFPDYIFYLPNLHILDMSENPGLTGILPKSNWGSPLITLNLYFTGFNGTLPSSICHLSSLQVLDLSFNNFSGIIPQCLGNLSSLQVLDLSFNNFSGIIPQCLGNLSNLMLLNMSHNQLRGPLLSDTSPSWLGHLPKLEVIDLGQNRFYGPIGGLYTGSILRILVLSHNSFSGHLPDFDGNLSLDVLDLSNNSLEGPIPKLPQVSRLLLLSNNNFTGGIPLSICMLDPFVLDLSSNNLTGAIPPCLLNKKDTIGAVINLGMNKLEGAIPDKFVENNSLKALNLKNNQLIGPFPRSMVNCKMLLLLDLSNNNIEDSFPNWLDTLPDLQVLILKSNKLNGNLKTSTDQPFPKLRLFDISNNNFIGLLPIEYISQLDAMKNENIFKEQLQYMNPVEAYGNIKAYFLAIDLTVKGSEIEFPKISMAWTTVDFSNNNFQGKIPEIIGELVALKGLNLSHNNLTGSIPLSIQDLTSLEWLDLSSNKLDGLIPTGLTHLTGLSALNLSYNDLRGMIPTGPQFDSFPMESFVGNTELCGRQINKTCGEHIPKQPQPPLPPTKEDDFNAFDWKIILMGYGSGLVIGISIGYMVFELRRPEWFVLLVEQKLLKKIARSPRWRI